MARRTTEAKMVALKPENVIWQNTSGHPEFSEASFISVLHEGNIWDAALFWPVDKALLEIAESYRKTPMPKELVLAIYDFQQYTFGRLCYHRMPSDLSRIDNLSDELCHSWSERLNSATRAAIGGYRIENEHFELVNPLL